RHESLGSYCRSLGLQWNHDGRWRPFVPTPLASHHYALPLPYSLFLTEADWSEIAAVLAAGWRPSAAMEAIGVAHHLAQEDHVAVAIVQAVVALDIVVSTRLRNGLAGAPALSQRLSSFRKLSAQ